MQLTFSWLKEHITTNISVEGLGDKLTDLGFEINSILFLGDGFFVVRVLSVKKIDRSDKLKLCSVFDGRDEYKVVCGASNVKEGMLAVFACIGTNIPKSNLIIKKVKIFGVESYGMLCSYDELGIDRPSDGIIDLDSSYYVGQKFTIDPIFDIAVTPNRGDCLSIHGIARDLAAAGCGNLVENDFLKIDYSLRNKISIKIDNYSDCRKFAGLCINGITNKKSPAWLARRLESIGQKSISAVIDVANYIMFTYGTPMHVYDLDKFSDSEIHIQSLKEDAKFLALDGNEYTVPRNSVVVCNNADIQCVAGIIGAKKSETTTQTKNIFLECANFNYISIANTRRKMQLDTESSYRFERQIDNSLIEKSIIAAADMIIKICGGKCSDVSVSEGLLDSREISFNPESFSRLTGIKVPHQRMKDILIRLGFKLEIKSDTWLLTVPSWRNDIKNQNCVVGEILRIRGYDNLECQIFHNDEIVFHKKRPSQKIRELFLGRGFKEVLTWSFTDESCAVNCHDDMRILNPITKKLSIMRSTAVYNLLDVLCSNIDNGSKSAMIFEVGPLFSNHSEEYALTALRSGCANERNIYGINHQMDIFDSKADALSVLRSFGCRDFKIDSDDLPSYYHPGRAGRFLHGDKVIAYFGEIHPELYKSRASICEVFFDRIATSNKFTERKLIKFQPVERDFSFVFDVARTPRLSIITDSIRSCDKIIRDVWLFDEYKDESDLHKGKVSLTFCVVMQDEDEVLDLPDIDRCSDKIISIVRKEFHGILRKEFDGK